MSIEDIQKQRLVDLIDYVEATERNQLKIDLDFQKQPGFRASEDELGFLPGVRLNQGTQEDPIWLQVDRVTKSSPPDPVDMELGLWIYYQDDPSILPTLKNDIPTVGLIKLGLIDDANAPDRMALVDYERRETVERCFRQWVHGPWSEWKGREEPRRRTIKLYNSLYLLRQQLDGVSDVPLELVCGLGFATLARHGRRLRYPLITMALELSLNVATHCIEARPRLEAMPIIEVEPLDRMNLNSLDQWRSASEAFLLEQEDRSLSPFAIESFEPVLRQAAALLDPDAIFLPDSHPEAGRVIPPVEDQLKVSNAFAFFQRERRATNLMEDLRRFRSALTGSAETPALPEAISALLTEPSDRVEDCQYPPFRGVSTISGVTSSNGEGQDLFFPKPFNREQVEVVQRLEVRPGVVVQGPPGTGKTHTIANIISHYLALGKRVLVTSQKAPALRVLRDKLPESVRPLAVSLIDSDREGLKQFQESVEIIAEKLQRLRQHEVLAEISELDHQIDSLHRNLARIDNEVDSIGRQAISPIILNGESIEPMKAARMIVDDPERSSWLLDEIDILPENNPKFSDSDIRALRQARKRIGQNIVYFGVNLPELTAFPPPDRLLATHNDLSRAEELQRRIGNGSLLGLRSTDSQSYERLRQLNDLLAGLTQLESQVVEADVDWTSDAIRTMRAGQDDEFWTAIGRLTPEIELLAREASYFLTRPIQLPIDAIEDVKFQEAVVRLSQGKSATGVLDKLFARKLKTKLSHVTLLGETVRTSEEWKEVLRYMGALKATQRLRVAWNHLVSYGLGNEIVHEGLLVLKAVQSQRAQLERMRSLIDQQILVDSLAWKTVDQWTQSVSSGEAVRCLLGEIVEAHMQKHRLETAEAVRESLLQVLTPGEGEISERLRQFIRYVLGDPGINSQRFLDEWQLLSRRLAEIQDLGDEFTTVRRVTTLISESGGENWAIALKETPVTGTEDPLLPGDWSERWCLRRLTVWLSRTDCHSRLTVLGRERREKEQLLNKAYERSIELRTWQQLSLKASDGVKSALAAYAEAVRRIGRGTGKSANRYRREARAASDRAKGALPCWIMPHYRVSESLPADLGLFDLVIVDEASQSTVSALPAVLRAKKILIVGDDKQVSPERVGQDQKTADDLAVRHLSSQVPDYKSSLREEQSLYDLGKVVFAGGAIMLTEHFRCVAPIIEFSKAQFYGHRLTPLRLPTESERLDPPLVDVFVEDGFRDGDINPAEADFIVSEIKEISKDTRMAGRTIGVTTLLGQSQAAHIYKKIEQSLGTEIMERHSIRVGDPTAFQGDERDIMFVSLVAEKDDSSLSGLPYEQRFNVALSRAKDRTYLVRSVEFDQLRQSDQLRRALLRHFSSPFTFEGNEVADRRKRCESDFEREVFDLLVDRGYRVNTQVPVGNYRIDLVVEGENDRRLALECDGDRFHGPDRWTDDLMRQRILERAGWTVWRCFASRFYRYKVAVLDELVQFLEEHGVTPVSGDNDHSSRHSEKRVWRTPRKEDQEEIEIASSFDESPAATILTDPVLVAGPAVVGPSVLVGQETSDVADNGLTPYGVPSDVEPQPSLFEDAP